jgi:hypothetical protein
MGGGKRKTPRKQPRDKFPLARAAKVS